MKFIDILPEEIFAEYAFAIEPRSDRLFQANSRSLFCLVAFNIHRELEFIDVVESLELGSGFEDFRGFQADFILRGVTETESLTRAP